MVSRFSSYIKESRAEFRRVNWPTRQETISMTGMVIAMSVAVAVFLGALDMLFNFIIKHYLL